jgi:hypothetical protein
MNIKHCFLILVMILVTSCNSAPAESNIPPTPIPPTNTLLPTATSTAIPTDTLTATPVPNGPCDNPLVPLVTGNEWTYRVIGQGDPYIYSLKVGERADIGNINIYVELIDQNRNQDIQELVICQDGAIDNFPLYVISMLLSDYSSGILNTYKKSGQYSPAYAVFAQNNWALAWEPRYLLEEAVGVRNPAGGSSIFLGRSSPIDLSFRTDGKFEPVTVPAGSFPQALVISNEYTMPATITGGGIITSGTVGILTTQWYVPYVGLVRARLDSASVYIMAGQESSFPMESMLELTEFEPGK